MTKELDRRFRHVGRIKRSWGTAHKPTIRAMEQMMDGLFARGRLDILKMIQDKTYTPLEVYDAWRVNELERLPTAATLAPLRETFEKWIKGKTYSAPHTRSLNQSLRHLLGTSGSNSSSVSSLPILLAKLREKMQGKHPRSFNLARAAAQAFAKTTAGRNSKLWQDITAIEVLRVTPQRTKHPLTPNELAAITLKMKPEYSDIAWGMASTGMGPSEFWGKWEILLDHVAIHGTKRAGRERIVPRIMPIYRPVVLYPAFRRAFEGAGDARPYDLRRTYANWLEAANIPYSRAQQYMGHKPKTVTDLYQWHEVSQHIQEDRERLIKYVLGATEKKALRLEKA